MPEVTVWLRNIASGEMSQPHTLSYQVGISHGIEVTRTNIGPVGPLTPSGPITTARDGEVYENLDITGFVDVRHDVTLRNCQIVGYPNGSNASYTIRHQRDQGALLTLQNCRVITRTAVTKGLVSWGRARTLAADTLFLGGTDNVYLKPTFSVPNGYAHIFTRCYFGDLQRYPGSHSDCLQIDGGQGGVYINTCSINSFALPDGEDPTTAQAQQSSLGSGGIILTYPSTNPEQISKVHIRNTFCDGGNWTVDTSPPDGPVPNDVWVLENQFGLYHRYGPLSAAPSQLLRNNVWAYTGLTSTGQLVNAGEPINEVGRSAALGQPAAIPDGLAAGTRRPTPEGG